MNIPQSKGAGLGLAICRELVTQLGGQIDLQSVVDKGRRSRFASPSPTRTALDPAPRNAMTTALNGRTGSADRECNACADYSIDMRETLFRQ